MAIDNSSGTSKVSTPHPEYVDRVEEWMTMRDAVRGATAIYNGGIDYLPMPEGFRAQLDGGLDMYASYLDRAQFPELVEPTIQGMVGIIHTQEARIDLPKSLEYLYEDPSGDDIPIESFHRRITQEILSCGRIELLADAPPSNRGGGDPRIKLYTAESLINWADDRTFFVLSECGLVRNGFQWENKDRWRVLEIVNGFYRQTEYVEEDVPGDVIEPRTRGGDRMRQIPLTIIGSRNLDVTPDNPPLIGVARSAIALYRLDADYRHQLFMSGQDTLVFAGMRKEDIPKYVGAGVALALSSPDSKAFYIGPSGKGIEAHRQAMVDERENAAALGARIFDTTQKNQAESGEALRIRRGATTATLRSVAMASAAGLERALRGCGRLYGLPDSEIKKILVVPNLDFIDNWLTADEAQKLVQVWQSGAISYSTLYENLQRGEIASVERDAQQERELIDSETPPDLQEEVTPPQNEL